MTDGFDLAERKPLSKYMYLSVILLGLFYLCGMFIEPQRKYRT